MRRLGEMVFVGVLLCVAVVLIIFFVIFSGTRSKAR
jgi:hypothetical protein